MSPSSFALSSYRQIPQQDPGDRDPNDPNPREFRGTTIPSDDSPEAMKAVAKVAAFRTYWLAAVLCCGGALFGYDSGVIGVFVNSTQLGVESNSKATRPS